MDEGKWDLNFRGTEQGPPCLHPFYHRPDPLKSDNNLTVNMTAYKILLGSQLSRISIFTLPDVLVTFQILLHTSITNVSPLYSLIWLGNWKNFGSSTYTSSDLMV